MKKFFVTLLLGILVLFGNYPILTAGIVEGGGPIDATVILAAALGAKYGKDKFANQFVENITHCKKEWADFIKVWGEFEEVAMVLPFTKRLEKEMLLREQQEFTRLKSEKAVAERNLNVCMRQLSRSQRLQDNARFQLLKAKQAPLNATLRGLLVYTVVRNAIRPFKNS